jgi:hypothetical protein
MVIPRKENPCAVLIQWRWKVAQAGVQLKKLFLAD